MAENPETIDGGLTVTDKDGRWSINYGENDHPEFSLTIPKGAVRGMTQEATISLTGRTIVLGANGAGKTSLLTYINDVLSPLNKHRHPLTKVHLRRPLFLQAARALPKTNFKIPPQEQAGLSTTGLDVVQDQAIEANDPSDTRLMKIVSAMIAREQTEKLAVFGRYEKWYTHKDGIPPEPATSLRKWFQAFSDVFPELELQLISDHAIRVSRGKEQYNIAALSDGERVVLYLLAELSLKTSGRPMVLVDEPEAHLNPALADQVWTALEAANPATVFVYATHSIPFAARGTCDRLYVAHGGGTAVEQVEDITGVSASAKAAI